MTFTDPVPYLLVKRKFKFLPLLKYFPTTGTSTGWIRLRIFNIKEKNKILANFTSGQDAADSGDKQDEESAGAGQPGGLRRGREQGEHTTGPCLLAKEPTAPPGGGGPGAATPPQEGGHQRGGQHHPPQDQGRQQKVKPFTTNNLKLVPEQYRYGTVCFILIKLSSNLTICCQFTM